MILSDIDIKKYIASGDIKIEPFDPDMLKPASYTFTLGPILMKPQSTGVVNALSENVKYQQITIPKNGYIINPGEFLLGEITEQLSISRKLACFHDARSTLTRIGLVVLQGSVLIQPGQANSHETLEITNISRHPIKVFAGMPIVKGIFMLLNTPSEGDYSKNGKYREQSIPQVILNEHAHPTQKTK
jgi:dCTP deaminase